MLNTLWKSWTQFMCVIFSKNFVRKCILNICEQLVLWPSRKVTLTRDKWIRLKIEEKWYEREQYGVKSVHKNNKWLSNHAIYIFFSFKRKLNDLMHSKTGDRD